MSRHWPPLTQGSSFQEPGHTAISANLSSLTAAANHFESECRMLIVRSQREPLNQNFVTQQVIQCAFDIAKATKQLVALFQWWNVASIRSISIDQTSYILLYFLLLYYYVKIMIWDLLFILQTYLLLTLQLRDQCHFISVNSTNFQCSTNRCVLWAY